MTVPTAQLDHARRPSGTATFSVCVEIVRLPSVLVLQVQISIFTVLQLY